jgi:hypothetical protein
LKMMFSSSDPHSDTPFWYSFWHTIWNLEIYIYILIFYLTFFLVYALTFYLTFYLTSILTYFLASILGFYLASILTFFLAFYLASILTYFLAYRHSFWNLFWHSIWHLFRHSLWHVFGPRCAQLYPELGIGFGSCQRSWLEGSRYGVPSREWVRERVSDGIAPLLRSYWCCWGLVLYLWFGKKSGNVNHESLVDAMILR